MLFDPPLQSAILIQRYKRFLADVRLPDGSQLTLHCPNTGSMLNCQVPGSRVWYSTAANPDRKYPHTWELVESPEGELIGINTGRANHLVREAIEAQRLVELRDYPVLRGEVSYGQEKSRIDLLLQGHASQPDCYVEIKNVSLGMGAGLGLFPDAVTQRGQKHLRELMQVRAAGLRAVLLFCVQHTGIAELRPADAIDPEYGMLLREASAQGVELLAYAASLAPGEITLAARLPVVLPGH